MFRKRKPNIICAKNEAPNSMTEKLRETFRSTIQDSENRTLSDKLERRLAQAKTVVGFHPMERFFYVKYREVHVIRVYPESCELIIDTTSISEFAKKAINLGLEIISKATHFVVGPIEQRNFAWSIPIFAKGAQPLDTLTSYYIGGYKKANLEGGRVSRFDLAFTSPNDMNVTAEGAFKALTYIYKQDYQETCLLHQLPYEIFEIVAHQVLDTWDDVAWKDGLARK